jgi:hypothetical protein
MRASHVVPVILATVLAGWLQGCDGTEPEPQPEVRVTASTSISLTGTVGTEVQPAPSVRATDEHGRPLAGVAITFKAASGGGTVVGGTVTTGADGSARPGKWTLGPIPGTQTLSAGASGKADVVFTALASVGPVAQITPSSGNNQLTGVGQGIEHPLVALAADAFGNPVAGIPVVFTVTAGGGTIAGDPVLTDSTGKATARPWTLGTEAGVQQVTAASGAVQAVFRAFAAAPPGELQGQIAFTSWHDPYLNIAVVNADGSGRTELTHPGRGLSPTWSPDGSLIAFVPDALNENGNFYGIGVLRADDASVSWLHEGLSFWDPAWSPDGTTILFAWGGTWGTYLASLSLADGRITPLVEGLDSPGQPSWSPEGRKFAFVSYRAGAPAISTANADGTGQTLLTDGHTGAGAMRYFLHPAWSPDGSMIAFVYGDPVPGSDTEFRVAVMTADGVFLKDLASAGPLRDDGEGGYLQPESLTWSPDGLGIAYTFEGCGPSGLVDCINSIRYVSLDGSRRETIANNAMSPAWRR